IHHYCNLLYTLHIPNRTDLPLPAWKHSRIAFLPNCDRAGEIVQRALSPRLAETHLRQKCPASPRCHSRRGQCHHRRFQECGPWSHSRRRSSQELRRRVQNEGEGGFLGIAKSGQVNRQQSERFWLKHGLRSQIDRESPVENRIWRSGLEYWCSVRA